MYQMQEIGNFDDKLSGLASVRVRNKIKRQEVLGYWDGSDTRNSLL